MSAIDGLEAALRVMIEEARTNARFRVRLETALLGSGTAAPRGRRTPLGDTEVRASRPRNRRVAAALDPFAAFATGGEAGLREALRSLDVERLKDVVAEYDMDRDRLALKWRSADRLIERVVETVVARNRKGDAFLPDKPPLRPNE